MSAVDEDCTETVRTVDGTWNVPGLRKEVFRLIQRCHKKIGRASQRLQKAQETVGRLTTTDASLEELENCPDVDALEIELKELQTRLQGLNSLEVALHSIKKKNTVLPPDVAAQAIDLGVDDKPPVITRGPGKKNGPRKMEKSRKPYRRYYSAGGVEIRVGKKAEDNDQLTLSPRHRDGADWWMHASGCPGSHVVIRFQGQSVPDDVLQDAAALAARQSKCTGSTVKVSVTRCRDVKKPAGAKPGLVQLTGKVLTVTVNMRQAAERLQRLEETVLIN
jgi:predicted ribosome quality control (RQC) complex YloA/Tae2 family protein